MPLQKCFFFSLVANLQISIAVYRFFLLFFFFLTFYRPKRFRLVFFLSKAAYGSYFSCEIQKLLCKFFKGVT